MSSQPGETKSTAVRFPNGRGQTLAGRLDLPAAGAPRGFALLIHCFTCGKDLKALYRLAKTLAAQGVGCLRFDFTGLGSSEGDFAYTDLATNREDLRAAADFLAREHEKPHLLIGHSLGGAAALLTAGELESVRALVLIGTPSDLSHLEQQLPEIRTAARTGAPAPVVLAGRTYAIGPRFLPVLQRFNLATAIQELRLPLLLLHSPRDEVVEPDHAENLYRWAHQPKSLAALDGADHLLSEDRHARYTARLIAAWAEPYLSPKADSEVNPQ